MTDGPAPAYARLIEDGTLKPDPAQRATVACLQVLHEELLDYRPAPPATEAKGFFGRLFGGGKVETKPAPSGLYIYGEVGRGKSMLMDLFFHSAPVGKKRRVHFHAFMQEVQERVHQRRKSGGEGNPIPDVARQIAGQATLLCFDEFQVENIADAMILGRLFQGLFDHGVVVVATSNVAPRNLYRDGLQRERFLPFIALIQERLDVHELESSTDYRLDRLRGRSTYYTPLGEEADKALDKAFADVTDFGGAAPANPGGARPQADCADYRKRCGPLHLRGTLRAASGCGRLSRHRAPLPHGVSGKHSAAAAGKTQ